MHNSQVIPFATIKRPLIVAALVVIALSGVSTPAQAQCGLVNIKGKLYDSGGAVTKVRCKGTEGNVLGSLVPGERLFLIDPTCALWPFTGTSDELYFTGAEVTVTKNGLPTKARKFAGPETGTGPVIGSLDSVAKTAGALGPMIRDKGRMAWTTGDFIFSGKYTAKLEPCP